MVTGIMNAKDEDGIGSTQKKNLRVYVPLLKTISLV
jgi:hypothetical protein